MAPRTTTTAARAAETPTHESGSSTLATPDEPTNATLEAAQEEIALLRAQLAATRSSTPPETTLTDTQRLTTALEKLAPRNIDRTRSMKLTDPLLLTDGVEPTFENWKLQLQDKLEINADHFLTPRARMAYVFSRTGGDAQTHLRPRYSTDAMDPFTDEQELIEHLSNVYEDPFKSRNARLEYRSLVMKSTDFFTAFLTRFYQLAGQAGIPTDDLLPDLYDKLTIKLQEVSLSFFTTCTDLREFTDHCTALDQGLRRIKARTDRFQARQTIRNTTNEPIGPLATRKEAPRFNRPGRGNQEAPSRAASTELLEPRTRPNYEDPKKQRLSDRGACFHCQKEGHFARNCPERTVSELTNTRENASDSGKGEP
jgi:hypothetical protein